MQAILSADLNWGIGYRGGELLMRVPEDMKRLQGHDHRQGSGHGQENT